MVPLVVVEKVKGALRLTAVDQRAAKLGLNFGLTLADARARIPNLAVAAADAQADVRLLEHLAELCDRFTPQVAIDLPHGLLLDITGCAHLFGDEKSLRVKVTSRLAHTGLSVRASIAGTPDAARALVHFSQPKARQLRIERLHHRDFAIGADGFAFRNRQNGTR